jgi:hypothetical protein
MSEIKYLGSNPPKYYLCCWKVKDHYLTVERTLFGGIFCRVRNEAEEIVVNYWPSTYHQTVILMQLNYLADEILRGNVANIRQLTSKQHFKNKWHNADDEKNPGWKKEYVEAVVKWVAEIWGDLLDPWQDNYLHIPTFPEEEAVRAFNDISPIIMKDQIPMPKEKPQTGRKLTKRIN